MGVIWFIIPPLHYNFAWCTFFHFRGENLHLDLDGILFLGGVRTTMSGNLPSQIVSKHGYKASILIIEIDAKKIRLAQNSSITKKSTDFCQSLWNLTKIISSWVSQIAWISAWLDKNCRFFTYGEILSQSNFFASVSKYTLVKTYLVIENTLKVPCAAYVDLYWPTNPNYLD